MEAISRGRLGKVKVVKAYIKAKFTLDYLGKEEPGCLGRLEEAAFHCREHSCQERDQLRRGSQHRRPLCLHGDLGAHGVPGGVPLGRLSLLEQALPGFKMLPIQDANNNLNLPFNKNLIRTALQ